MAPLDPQSMGLDVAQRAAGEVLALQRHGEKFDQPLSRPDRPRRSFDVIGEQ